MRWKSIHRQLITQVPNPRNSSLSWAVTQTRLTASFSRATSARKNSQRSKLLSGEISNFISQHRCKFTKNKTNLWWLRQARQFFLQPFIWTVPLWAIIFISRTIFYILFTGRKKYRVKEWRLSLKKLLRAAENYWEKVFPLPKLRSLDVSLTSIR